MTCQVYNIYNDPRNGADKLEPQQRILGFAFITICYIYHRLLLNFTFIHYCFIYTSLFLSNRYSFPQILHIALSLYKPILSCFRPCGQIVISLIIR